MGEMTISEYDMQVMRNAEKEKDRILELRKSRHGIYIGIVTGFFVVTFVLGVLFILWLTFKGPSASQMLEQEHRIACVESGGTFVKVDAGQSSSEGVCFRGTPESE